MFLHYHSGLYVTVCGFFSLTLTCPAWSLVSDTITYTGDNLTFDPLRSLKSVDNHSIADRAGVTPPHHDKTDAESREKLQKKQQRHNMKDKRLVLAVM